MGGTNDGFCMVVKVPVEVASVKTLIILLFAPDNAIPCPAITDAKPVSILTTLETEPSKIVCVPSRLMVKALGTFTTCNWWGGTNVASPVVKVPVEVASVKILIILPSAPDIAIPCPAWTDAKPTGIVILWLLPPL